MENITSCDALRIRVTSETLAQRYFAYLPVSCGVMSG